MSGWLLILSWWVLFLPVTLTQWLLGYSILDEIEQGLPLADRQSWRAVRRRQYVALEELHLHAKMFPSRRKIRAYWILAVTIFYALLLGGLIALYVAKA